MKVVWIVPERLLQVGVDGRRVDMASVRYHALIPVQGLVARGHDASVVGPSAERFDAVRSQIADADRVVFIKNYLDEACSERMLEEVAAAGVKTLFDLTDDRFEHKRGPHLQRMVGRAQVVVTVSTMLQQIIQNHTGRVAAIVGDPFEGPRGTPRYKPQGRRLKALWFGSHTNIGSLKQALPTLLDAGRKHPFDLRIVTREMDGFERDCKEFNSRYRNALSLRFAKWTVEETWRSLVDCNFVVIPALNAEWALAKSANRIIEALWAGRFVICHPIPSYVEFKEWAWIGEKLEEGVAWMVQNAGLIEDRVTAGQEYIATKYSPAAIAEQWERILEAA